MFQATGANGRRRDEPAFPNGPPRSLPRLTSCEVDNAVNSSCYRGLEIADVRQRVWRISI
jgi:hypothetical protein